MSTQFAPISKVGTGILNVITWPVRHWRVSATILIALVIVYVVMDQMLLRKLAAQRETMCSSGMAVSLDDLVPNELHDSQNAAVDYRYASALIARAGGESEAWYALYERFRNQQGPPEEGSSRTKRGEEEKSAPLTDDELARLDRYLADFQPALGILKKAQSLQGCKFRNYDNPEAIAADPGGLLPTLSFIRNLARGVALKALREGEQGNHEEAFEWITVGLHITNNSDADPVLISGLVRAACAGIFQKAMEDLLYRGDIPANLSPAFYKELATLGERARFGRVLEGERCFSSAMQTHQERSTPAFARPFHTLQRIKLNNLQFIMRDLVTEPDFAQRQALRATIEAFGESKSPLNIMRTILAPALLRGTDAFDRQVAQARLCELAIALKRHKRDHGAYPTDLDALVPAYLESLPEDPWSGRSFGYRQEGEGFELFSADFPFPHGARNVTWRSIR